MQKVLIFREKKAVHQVDSNPRLPACKSVALPIELSVLWFLMECCSSFLHFQPAAECNLITALTHGYKVEVER